MFNVFVCVPTFSMYCSKCMQGERKPLHVKASVRLVQYSLHSTVFLSASLYRLCRDVVGRWLVGWLVVTRVHCGQTVHSRPIVTMEH